MSGYHELDIHFDSDPNKYLNSVIGLINFDYFLDINDKRVNEYLDHLVLRMFNVMDSRTHFPIIIESRKNHFFNR